MVLMQESDPPCEVHQPQKEDDGKKFDVDISEEKSKLSKPSSMYSYRPTAYQRVSSGVPSALGNENFVSTKTFWMLSSLASNLW